MSIMFIQAGIEKIFAYTGTEGYMQAHGVPGWLLPAVIFVEAVCGLGVLLGFVVQARVDQRLFNRFVVGVIFVIGLSLVTRALTG
jgi:putative oxidoreductase